MRYLDAFRRTVRCHGSETAIVSSDGRSFTYEKFDRRSSQLANALSERLGDDPCAVLGFNSPEVIESMIAGHKRAGATVQLPFRGKSDELVRKSEAANATGLLFGDEKIETARMMLDHGEFEIAIHFGERDPNMDGVKSYEAVLEDADDELHSDLPAGERVSVFYTSGTTSLPKAVPFTGEQLWYGAIQGVMEHGIDTTDTGVMTTPWYHMVSSDAWLYPHFLAGATVVVQTEFDPTETLELIEENEATGLLAVPTQLSAINDTQATTRTNTETLSYIRTGGSVVSARLVERTSELLCGDIYNTYGMTEAGPNLAFAHPVDQRERPGTIGKESHTYELRVVEAVDVLETPDPEATVDAGEKGEVIARGPGRTDGYIDNPQAEEKSFFGEWLRTRDVARVDEDGFLYIVDRVDNMFQSGGENVYPVEVETALEGHDALVEAFVYGADDEHWGNVVSAIVVTSDHVSEDELDRFCRESSELADYKRPRNYEIRAESEDLPRTSTGKLKRSELLSEADS